MYNKKKKAPEKNHKIRYNLRYLNIKGAAAMYTINPFPLEYNATNAIKVAKRKDLIPPCE
jgi:hypothetical protein